MSEHELEKLLGGFAADTLTPEERQKLFKAALQEQQLFNALADEQALKELLTDPMVRRKLLDALQRPNAARTEGSLSWWQWLRRPAGLTFAGGLTAAIVAVVIGTKVYQDSLKQAAQSVATEERPTASPAPAPSTSQPARPSIAEPQPKARKSAGPTKEKDALRDKNAKQERPSTSPSQPQEQRASESAGDRVQRHKPDEVGKQADAPVPSLNKTAEDIPSSADQKLKASGAPPAAPTEVNPMDAPAPAPLPGVAASRSARALFYEQGAIRADKPALAREKGRARLEQKAEPFASTGKASGEKMTLKPLGLRYSFVVRGNDGENREVDTATALKNSAQARVTVEANQDAYFQILKTVGTAPPQLFYPRGDARTSLPIVAGKRYEVPLPASEESVPATLIVRLSREPLQERQEAGSADRLSPDQLIESVTPGGTSGSQEQATYVITLDPAPTAQIAVDMLFAP